jgi:flagellar basal body-associated protein FliL
MDGNSAFQTQPAYVQKTSNRKRLIIIFLVVLVLIVASLGALYLLGSSAKKPPVQPTAPIPTQLPAASPTPASSSAQLSPTTGTTAAPKVTPTPGVTALSVSVLNGSGTPGAAGQTAAALKTAGFTNVTTGNASAYTYTGITVHVKNKNNLATVEKAVQDANPNVKITTGVDPSLSTDIEVIVGK